MNKVVVLERQVSKSLQPQKIRTQMQSIASTACNGPRGAGWMFTIPNKLPDPVHKDGNICYQVSLHLRTTSNRKSVEEKFPNIVQRLAQAGCAGPYKAKPWTVIEPAGYAKFAAQAEEEVKSAKARKEKANEIKEIGEINLNPNGYFEHIFGRQPQINRVLSAIQLGHRTDWNKRVNSVLDGEPGCGKTEIMKAIAKMLGKEDEAYTWVDATSTTRAGMLEKLINGSYIPPVMFIEEIEKCEENALRWLLGVMDIRGQVRRLNYRTGPQCENVKMVVIATANDVKLLKSMMSGALYSRFQNKIYCPRPDREIMKQILLREIKEIKGKKEWIEPTLSFAVDKWGISDPRDIITICSCGGDRLMNGEYQSDYEATMHPLEKEELQKQKELLN